MSNTDYRIILQVNPKSADALKTAQQTSLQLWRRLSLSSAARASQKRTQGFNKAATITIQKMRPISAKAVENVAMEKSRHAW